MLTNRQLFKRAFQKPQDLKAAQNSSFFRAFLYVIFLSLILSLPLAKSVFQELNEFQQENQKIAAEIPAFHLENNQIVLEEDAEGFIYQTDWLNFTFDPEGKRKKQDVINDFSNNLFSIGILQDQLVFSADIGEEYLAILGTNTIELPYSDSYFQNFDSQHLKATLSQGLSWQFYLLFFAIVLYQAFWQLIWALLLAAVGGKIYTALRRTPLKFSKIFKTVIYTATLPVLVAAVILLLPINLDISIFITLVSMFIFMQVIKPAPPEDLPS
ncbi:hypothetical protein M2139_000731 [Enterococcus sp. PF1-24]|uniref:DUF1189 domain-containing protein n=1 Tax=unclassified Enterococcus TaxID=2608891 RepID=UPI002473763A|nr:MULTISPECIES: DUF1189 domain-containing protein [unclassified Enterococcus]MDH6363614.1 hypothetical protein [Enterococcus sp. PFB1-1]MDH6400849.1 hypothetical protein [Enterococcus sp. PF1-24]